MSPHHRQKGDPRPPRDSSHTLIAVGVVLFVLGVIFFAAVNCAKTWGDETTPIPTTFCGFGDPRSWDSYPGLGYMVWLRVVLLATGGLMVVCGAVLKGNTRRADGGDNEAADADG